MVKREVWGFRMNSVIVEHEPETGRDDEALDLRRVEIAGSPFPAPRGALPHTWNEFKKLKRQVRDVAVQELERQFLIDTLDHCGGNVSRAAAEIGIQRTNLHALMRKHGLTSGRKALDRVA